MLNIPIIPNLTTYAVVGGVSILVGFYGGYKLTSNYYDAKQSKVDQAVIEQLVNQASIDRKVIENYQINEHTLQRAYIELGRKSREVKITTSKCELTESGRVLWNESLLGETVLPETPSGVTGTGTTDFASAFENKLLNDQQCSKMREKLEALKKWDEDTFKD
jgi:uncharacterized protein YneF (UPF0154 family)